MEEKEYTYMVGIISITFNQSKFILDTLNGFVMQQTNFPFVAMVIDDASTDGEQEVIKKFVTEQFDTTDTSIAYEKETDYAHITYARHKTNKNCYMAVLYLKENHYSQRKPKRPYLAEWRDHVKYEALCEGDDYWIDAQKLQKQVDFLEEHEEYSMCSCGLNQIYNENIVETICFKKGKRKGFDYDLDNYNNYALAWTLTICYRRRFYEEDCQKKYKYPRDVTVIYELLKKGKGYYMSEVMANYRIWEGGISSSIPKKEKVTTAFKIYKDMYKKDSTTYTRKYLRNVLRSLYVTGYYSRYKSKVFILNAWKLADSVKEKMDVLITILVKLFYKLKIRFKQILFIQ